MILRKASMKKGLKIHRRSRQEVEDTTETAEGNTTENTGIPDEQTEDIAEAADGDTEDIACRVPRRIQRLPKHRRIVF